jgi:hypothetical protein
MAINSININKKNNHLSSKLTKHKKKSLNNDSVYTFFFVFSELRWEEIVCFVDIGGIADH